jgi:hypothetical protein
VLCLSVSAVLASRAAAQDEPDAPVAPASPPPAVVAEARVEVDQVEPAAPEPSAPATTDPPRASELPAGYAVPEPEPPRALYATAEIAIGFAPTVGFSIASGLGGLAGLTSAGNFTIGARTDFAFAVDERAFLGFGLSLSHSEGDASASSVAGTTRLEVPLVVQLYLDQVRVGSAVPTLRIVPAFRWTRLEAFGGGFPIVRETAGGRFDFAIGVTWFPTSWLGVRLLGDIGVSVDVAYQNGDEKDVDAYVGGSVGVVVRM